MLRTTVIVSALVVCVGCSKHEQLSEDAPILLQGGEAALSIPDGFPEIVFPDDNPFSKAKWELGKALFYDPALSNDFSTSCSSCHKPEFAFADNVPVSKGAGGERGSRNSPSLANVAYAPYFTREGGVPTLETQVLVPIQEHAEFNFNILALADRLNENSMYVELSREAFGKEVDAFVITRALATFERTLISGNSPFDRFFYQGKINALSPAQKRGMDLFFGDRTSCSTCHAGFMFTDHRITNNGLYESYDDEGKFRLTKDSADFALFKVPSLRNVGVTGPYMHDGSIVSLRGVIEHYNSGGKSNPQKSVLVQPLHLSEQEKEDLLQFLYALTDAEFIQNKHNQ